MSAKTANACNVSIVSDYDMNNIRNANEDIRSLKSLILFGVRGMAAYAYHAMTLGYTDASLNQFFLTALDSLSKDWGMNELLPIVMEVGRFNLTCMELLDRANTKTFGDPVPVSVSLTVEKGPFIVVLVTISRISSSFLSRQRTRASISTPTARFFRLTLIQNLRSTLT